MLYFIKVGYSNITAASRVFKSKTMFANKFLIQTQVISKNVNIHKYNINIQD